MSTATEILTQLEELWESAEPGPTREGDAIIYRYEEGDYRIEPSADRSRDSLDHIRTLERAKPKAPEWEAVVASHVDDETPRREVYFRTEGGAWESDTRIVASGGLVDPVPLVEMPSREEVREALVAAWQGQNWPDTTTAVEAVLELLRGGRKA